MTKTIEALRMELFVAERALLASMHAVEIEGKGGRTWVLFKEHAKRTRALRQQLVAFDSKEQTAHRSHTLQPL